MGRTPGVCAVPFHSSWRRRTAKTSASSLVETFGVLFVCGVAGVRFCPAAQISFAVYTGIVYWSYYHLILTGTINYLHCQHNNYFCHFKWPGTGIRTFLKNVCHLKILRSNSKFFAEHTNHYASRCEIESLGICAPLIRTVCLIMKRQ